jgi:hypothetical protein
MHRKTMHFAYVKLSASPNLIDARDAPRLALLP